MPTAARDTVIHTYECSVDIMHLIGSSLCGKERKKVAESLAPQAFARKGGRPPGLSEYSEIFYALTICVKIFVTRGRNPLRSLSASLSASL